MASASCACTTVAGHWPGSPWHKSVAGSCEKQKKKKSPKVLIQYILCNVHCQKVIHVFTIHCAAHLQPLNLLGRELVGVQDLAQGYYYQTEKKISQWNQFWASIKIYPKCSNTFFLPRPLWCVKTETQNKYLTPTPHLLLQTLRRR